MYVVDASVWVSYFMQTEATHLASRDWITRKADAGIPILGPSHVLAEISWGRLPSHEKGRTGTNDLYGHQ